MEDLVINSALQILGNETGIRGAWERSIYHGTDGRLTLHYNGKDFTYYVTALKDVRQYHLGRIIDMAATHYPFLVIAERILPPVKKTLQEKGIAYLETNGNAHLQNPPLYIHIDTHLPVRKDKPVTNRAFTKTGLKVIFHFLNNKNAINDNFRKIAADTGIALGNVTYIQDGLTEAGYILNINRKDIRLKNITALLERWIAGYRETLKPSLLIGSFRLPDKEAFQNWKNLDLKLIDAAWSAEPAGDILTNYLKANRLQLYTALSKIQVMQQWKLIPDKDGKVEVYQRFWRQPDGAPDHTVPLLLVYTDLLITEDPRCIETAGRIYQKYLKNEFENN